MSVPAPVAGRLQRAVFASHDASASAQAALI